jgi:hypothetical protein
VKANSTTPNSSTKFGFNILGWIHRLSSNNTDEGCVDWIPCTYGKSFIRVTKQDTSKPPLKKEYRFKLLYTESCKNASTYVPRYLTHDDINSEARLIVMIKDRDSHKNLQVPLFFSLSRCMLRVEETCMGTITTVQVASIVTLYSKYNVLMS